MRRSYHPPGATGDLRAVDTKRGVFYFLGDTHAGTTLVGQALADGALVCAGAVPLKEVGFVGMGQSMTVRAALGRLGALSVFL